MRAACWAVRLLTSRRNRGPLRLAPATEGNARPREAERCEHGATPVPVAKRAAGERDLEVAAVERAGAADMARVAAKRRFARDATDFFAEQPRAFRSGAHVRAEFGRMEHAFVVAEAFRAQLEAFANLFAPKSWIEDFRTKGDDASARVVSNDDFAGGLFRLDRRRRRYADARRVVRFGEHDAASVDRRAGYAGCYEPKGDDERGDADGTDAHYSPSARSKLLRRWQAISDSRGLA
jgi:hypothetical protein